MKLLKEQEMYQKISKMNSLSSKHLLYAVLQLRKSHQKEEKFSQYLKTKRLSRKD